MDTSRLRKTVAGSLVAGALAILAGAAVAGAASDAKEWQHTVEVERPPRRGQPQPPAVGHLWIPEGCKVVRGLVVGGKTLLEKRVLTDSQVRKAAEEKGMGALYFDPALDAVFDYVNQGSGERLEKALADLARTSGHPEVEFTPLLTVGHSTGGIFCRNVAFWKPERVIGVLHIMSGNFQDGLWDKSRSIAGVPFLAINGEFEEYGPMGGDLKGGLRSEYSLNPDNKSKQNQTQWVMVRMQILDRRRRNPDNLMSLVVHRGKGHTSWDDAMSALAAQFVRSAADARIPKEPPDGRTVVRCRTVKASDGWLSDADIKDPKFPPAPYAQYQGDKRLAFWHLDRAMAEAVDAYHKGPWSVPDPTAGQPPEKRYVPPEMLRDTIDAPKP